MTVRMENTNNGMSRFYFSYDRGHTWQGPYACRSSARKGSWAAPTIIVNGPRDCLLFLTASKANGREGRPFCARTTDGGLTWQLPLVHRARADRLCDHALDGAALADATS